MERNFVLKALLDALMKSNLLENWKILPGKRNKTHVNICFGDKLPELSDIEEDGESPILDINSSQYFKRKTDYHIKRDLNRVQIHNPDHRRSSARNRKQTEFYKSDIENTRQEFDLVYQTHGFISPEQVVHNSSLDPRAEPFVYISHASPTLQPCDTTSDEVVTPEDDPYQVDLPELPSDVTESPSMNESLHSHDSLNDSTHTPTEGLRLKHMVENLDLYAEYLETVPQNDTSEYIDSDSSSDGTVTTPTTNQDEKAEATRLIIRNGVRYPADCDFDKADTASESDAETASDSEAVATKLIISNGVCYPAGYDFDRVSTASESDSIDSVDGATALENLQDATRCSDTSGESPP